MQELSVYKKNLRPAILEEAMRRFREYGIRAVKMDDIAKNMGISKRTLYEVYSDKEDLLVDVVKSLLKQRNESLQEFALKRDDAIDILIEALRQQMEFSASTHANFFNDLKRYPAVEKMLKHYQKEQEISTLAFFENGVRQGLFISSIDFNIFHKITSGSISMIRSEELFKNLTYQQLMVNYLFVIIRGICTRKGLERLDNFIETIE
jgi:AcrR family transcriptional regulator